MRKAFSISLLVFVLGGGNPLAAADDAELVAAGEALYETNCAECHGERLRNTGTTFDLRELRAGERARFDNSVLGGRGQMPPWRGVLEADDLDRLWAYIRAYAYQ